MADFCSKCGSRLDIGARFCENCGSPVEGFPNVGSKPQKSNTGLIIGIIIGAVAIISLLLVLLFVKPGFLRRNKEQPEEIQTVELNSEPAKEEEEEEPEPASEEAEAPSEEPGEEETVSEDEAEPLPYGGPEIEEQVMINDKNIKLTAKSLYVDDETGDLHLIADLENKSDEAFAPFSGEAYVNDLHTSAAFGENDGIEAGETVEKDIRFRGYSLYMNDIEQVGTMGLSVRGYKVDGYGLIFESEYGEIDTNLKGTFEQNEPDDGENLTVTGVEGIGDMVTIKYQGYFELGELMEDAATLAFYVKNTSDEALTIFNPFPPVVNGDTEMFSAGILETYAPGKSGISFLTISDWELEDENIDEVKTLVATMGIYTDPDVADKDQIGACDITLDTTVDTQGDVVGLFDTTATPKEDEFLWFWEFVVSDGDSLDDMDIYNYGKDAYTGNWKAYMVHGDNADVYWLMNAEVKQAGDRIMLVLYPKVETTDDSDKESDISNLAPIKYSGKWANNVQFDAEGDDGKIDAMIFGTSDAQYVIADIEFTDGTDGYLAMTRP